MPVEFLTDEQAAGYGRYDGPPSRAQLDRFFFLDHADWGLIGPKRRDPNRLGFAVQLCTGRFLGTFLTDLGEVPEEAVVYLAEQLGVDDPGCLDEYAEREQTRLDHAEEIRRECGFTDFADRRDDVRAWLEAQVWTTTDGPKALFDGAVAWMRRRAVLLPGVTTLARLVAQVRDEVTGRLWEELCALLSPEQRAGLETLLVVPEGARISNLERADPPVGAGDGARAGSGRRALWAGAGGGGSVGVPGPARHRAGPVWAGGQGAAAAPSR
ncbi:DUF4158 domain-containing protein [Spirillospora sp. CA-255316]